LPELIRKREENILLVSTWTHKEIEEMIKRYREAKEIALEQDKFEATEILDEKISQFIKAQRHKLRFTYFTDDRINW